jgi:hypothetical protein
MNTNEQNAQNEQMITVRAVYLGSDPTMSEPEDAFCLGSIPILEGAQPLSKKAKQLRKFVDESHKSSGANYRPICKPYYYVEFMKGSTVVDTKEGRVGVTPNTILVLYDVLISEAETLNGVLNWRFEKLAWNKYRTLIQKEYERISGIKDKLLEKLTVQWGKFYGLQLDQEVPKVINFDVRIGKQQKNNESKSHDQFNWHVKITKIKLADFFSALEYIEQAFFLLDVDCEIRVSFDDTEIYRTPKGLTDEKNEEA